MKDLLKVFIMGLIAALLILPGCSNNSGGSSNADNQITGGFTYKVAAVYEKSTGRSGKRAPQNLKGTMTITNQADMSTQIVDWYVVIDEQAFTATSNKTYVLVPGDYTFDLVVDADAGNHQYVGSSSLVTIADDGGQTVRITIRPVIGDITTVIDLTELSAFKLSYPAAELVDVANPRIGIAVNGGPIQMFSINTASGLFEEEIPTTPMWSSGYIKLVPGNYHLDLTLYTGATLIGKSINIQENVSVYSDDLTMDIIPLYGEAVVNLPMEGSDAVFNLVIPNEIVEEVGGTFNLFTLFQLEGTTGANADASGDQIRTVPMTPGSWQPCDTDPDSHCAAVTLSNMRYDVSTLMLMFADMAGNETVGMGYLYPIELNDSAISHTIAVTLVRRNIIGGHILGILGVNVYDLENNPVPGATILSNNVPVGITGLGGTFGTAGYVKLYLQAGVQTIRAEYDTGSGLLAKNQEIDLSPLEILSIDLVVEPADCSTMDCNQLVSDSTCAMLGDPSIPTCDCTDGWSGTNCQDYDPCWSTATCNVAGGGGTCADAGGAEPSSAECTCNEFWTSTNDTDPLTTCDIPPAICDGVDCNQANNGGNCQDNGGVPMCACNPGFSGSACEIWDPCATELNACNQNEGQGTCVDNGGLADCTCTTGWLIGDGSCNDPDWCVSDPCNSNGTCNEAEETCSCDSPYTGTDCLARIDDDIITCRYDSAQSTGNCADYPMVEDWDLTEATAHCTVNATATPPNMVLVTGDSCLVQNANAGGAIDRCYAPELCGTFPNAAACSVANGDDHDALYYYAYLMDGYQNVCSSFIQGEYQDGPFLQVPYSVSTLCDGVVCGANSACNPADGSCVCLPGFSGVNCEIDACDSMDCGANGSCAAGACECTGGWTGDNCEVAPPTDSCNPAEFPEATYYCNLKGPYTEEAEECTIYIGTSWTDTEASTECSEEGYSSPIDAVISENPCDCTKPVVGYCLKPKAGKEALTIYYFEGSFATGVADEDMIKGICESSYGGTWTSGGQAPVVQTYALMDEAYAAMNPTEGVLVYPDCTDVADASGDIPCLDTLVQNDDYIIFSPDTTDDPTAGLIIYPGAGVDPRAYAPAAQMITKKGYQVFIVPMTSNFALPEYHRAGIVISENPAIVDWFIAGHSMGGTAAARYIMENPTDLDGLIMWGSYTDESYSIAAVDIDVMSLYGSRDGLSTVQKVTVDNVAYLPSDTRYYSLLGGNHAQFGYYGLQDGDLDSGISREHQHDLFASATVYHMKSVIESAGDDITLGYATINDLFESVDGKEITWPEEVQLIVGNVDAAFTMNEIEAVTYDNLAGGFVDSKAALDPVTGIVTIRSFQYQYANADDLSLPPIYTGEFWVKSKLQDTLVSDLGYTAAGPRQYCQDVNEAIINWALTETGGAALLPQLADASYATGGEWVPAEMTFIEDGGIYTLTSAYLEVEPDDPTAPEGGDGVIYCKVWGPARALVWALKGQ